jgi:hypothetical protein
MTAGSWGAPVCIGCLKVCVCRVCVRAASFHNEGHAKYAEEASKMWAEAKTDAYLELDIKGVKSELTRYMY